MRGNANDGRTGCAKTGAGATRVVTRDEASRPRPGQACGEPPVHGAWPPVTTGNQISISPEAVAES